MYLFYFLFACNCQEIFVTICYIHEHENMCLVPLGIFLLKIKYVHYQHCIYVSKWNE